MAAIIEPPHQNKIVQSSGPKREGYNISRLNYGTNISQKAYLGPTIATSRSELWVINWKGISYETPEDVANGAINELQDIINFYTQAQQAFVRYTPYELGYPIIFEVVEDSLKRNQVAGKVWEVSIDLDYKYRE